MEDIGPIIFVTLGVLLAAFWVFSIAAVLLAGAGEPLVATAIWTVVYLIFVTFCKIKKVL